MNTKKADHLFASPSALSGIARFFDMAGVYDVYNGSASEADADCKAVYLDWSCVGENLREALQKALTEHREKLLLR